MIKRQKTCHFQHILKEPSYKIRHFWQLKQEIDCSSHLFGYQILNTLFIRMDRDKERVFWTWMPKHRKWINKLIGGLPSNLVHGKLFLFIHFARIHVRRKRAAQLWTGSMRPTMCASWELVLSLLFLQSTRCQTGRPSLSLIPQPHFPPHLLPSVMDTVHI